MRNLLFPIFLFVSLTASGQQVFYSPFTHTYPTIFTSKIEDVNRRITLEPNTITIATETEEGKEIEILAIQATEIINGNFVFLCQNRSKQKITIAIPEGQEQIEIIDYFFRSPKTNEEIQLRFYVEQIK